MALLENWDEQQVFGAADLSASRRTPSLHPSSTSALSSGPGSASSNLPSTSSTGASGYVNVNAALEFQDPMFSLSRVEYQPQGLIKLVVSNDILCMAVANSRIVRLNLQNPSMKDDIKISTKSDDKLRQDDMIHSLFLDPTGNHLIITLNNGENYYLHSSLKKAKFLSKMKGQLIEAIAWNPQNEDQTTTTEIIVGTNLGQLFETVIESRDGKERYFKPLYTLPEGAAVAGIQYEVFPPVSGKQKKFFIMAITATRIYQFIGGPTFESLFTSYESSPGFHELPGSLDHSKLCFFRPFSGMAQSFAWLTGPGIYHGDLVFGSQGRGDAVMTGTKLLNPNPELSPISLALTSFHFLLLYDNKFQAVCKLNDEVVYEERLPRSQNIGRLQGMATDPVTGSIWVYAERCVWEAIVTKEDRFVWKLYLDKGKYEEALQYCDDVTKRDEVRQAQAEHYFKQGQYELSAKIFGQTQRSFEDVTLRFIHIDEKSALKKYLLQKLESTKAKDATQITLLCSWLCEMYLHQLNELEASPEQRDKFVDVQDEFKIFLEEYQKHLNPATTFSLISSHGRLDELLFYATLIEDYERVISFYIRKGDYKNALKVMSKQTSEEIYYKFSAVLMEHCPKEVVNAWISAPFLKPIQLIPSLMHYQHRPSTSSSSLDPSSSKEHQGIRYLQHCVHRLQNKDAAIHNYLLTLYAQQTGHEGPLLTFLNSPDMCYDLKYALRLCTKYNKTQACVLIYSQMGLYEEAVDLALKVDLELAKINADKPEDDEALRKKLWLKIARDVVKKEKGIKSAMEFLNHCDVLKIEDILPFFPDFALIDDFKDEICNSLEDYNRHIEELKEEMDEATSSADLIRQDIKKLRNKYGFVSATQKCEICGMNVLSRNFYLFPCQHVFHADCLINEMMSHLTSMQRNRVHELASRINNEMKPSFKEGEVVSSIDKLKEELDSIVASECIYCGNIMVKSIDLPFISNDERDDIESWQL